MEGGSQPAQFAFHLPAELQAGSYANMVSVWHTGHEFTLDFAVTLPPSPNEQGAMVVPCEVVARLKVAPSLVFDVLRTLNENMTNYEAKFGEIKRPEPRQEDDDG